MNIDDREGYARLFELISPLLLQLKPALVGSHLFLSKFVKNNEFNFVRENLLPFFDCCTHFKFPIDCTPEERSVFLASLLQQPSIERALSVDLSFYRYYHNAAPTHLPIDVISKWLNNPAPSNNKIKGNRRLLRLYFANNIGNMQAMVEHLKKVAWHFSAFFFTLLLSTLHQQISFSAIMCIKNHLRMVEEIFMPFIHL